MLILLTFCVLFLFNAPAPTEIYTLFPTRRSSDLPPSGTSSHCFSCRPSIAGRCAIDTSAPPRLRTSCARRTGVEDRKSTRLNSSHTVISYAVFCLKKKKQKPDRIIITQEHSHKTQ